MSRMSGNGTTGLLRPLDLADEEALGLLLDRHPERDVYMRGLIWRLGARVPPEVGTLLGWFVEGELVGVFLQGPVVVIACDDPAGLVAFARRVGDYWYEQPVSQLMAPRRMSQVFLGELSEHFGEMPPLFLLRHNMPAMRLVRGALKSPGELGLDPSEPLADVQQAPADAEALLSDLARAVTLEDLGIDPLDFARDSFLVALQHRIRLGREYLWTEGGRPRFRAALSAVTPEAVLIEGVYVPPEMRRRGYGKAGMYALCDRLLRHHKSVVLLVGEDNDAARTLYDLLGFETFDAYQAAFFEPPPPPRASWPSRPPAS